MGQASLVEVPLKKGSTSGASIVSVRSLEKRYKKSLAVRDVSFELHAREMFGLIGPDGSGKSSVLRSIAGVQQYDKGSVEVFGQRVNSERSAEKIKDRLGLMPQGLGNNLYAQLSIDENIDYFAGLRLVPSIELRRRKERLLEMTRLDSFRHRQMKKLSGGMKQKLGLVCTLIHEPELLLLDEPTTGVDPVSRREFWEILTELVHELGISAIVATAYMDEAAYLDRLALFMDGQIVSQGSEKEIKSLVAGTVVSFQASEPLIAFDRIRPTFPHTQTLGDVVRVFVPGDDTSAASMKVSTLGLVDDQPMALSAPDLEDTLAYLLTQNSSNKTLTPACFTAHPRLSTQPHRTTRIQAQELVREFGDFRAVDGVSFEVPSGRIFGLLGANGAGKTTVIKMLTGLLPPSAGTGNVAGVNMKKPGQEIKQNIGYMSQSFSLYVDLTVLENLEFYAGVYGLLPRERKRRIPEVVRMTGLDGMERRVTADLPMGLRQRLALGCALVHKPSVIFLDEPTSGVDVLGRRQFWEILDRLAQADDVSILVTTHYMTEAEHCDELALMYAGRIIRHGTPTELKDELVEDVGAPLSLVVSNPLQALRVARQHGFTWAALFGQSLRILTKEPDRDTNSLRALLGQHQIEILATEHDSATIDDIFVHAVLSADGSRLRREVEP